MACQNIWGIGQNYSLHAAEMGATLPSEPMVFLKSGSCLVLSKEPLKLPAWSKDVHYEVELALRMGGKGKITHAAVACDLTARDVQKEAKKKGAPWTLAKSFKGSCPIGPAFPVKNLDELHNLDLILHLNGEKKQHGNTQDMIFKPETLLKYISEHFPIMPEDWILTGTPQGVGSIKPGDLLRIEIPSLSVAEWTAS